MFSKSVVSFSLMKRSGILLPYKRFHLSKSVMSASTDNASSQGRASAAVLQSKDTANKQIEITLNPPKGTRDFYPEDQRLKNWLFGIWKDVAKQYGFEEYDAPIVEHVELYIRKAGEEVTQQLYDFEDKGGRRLSLRPEMTPSLARMILAKQNTLSFPLKWFAIPQCWRYERMTRGRRREHYQWNMDIFGVQGVEAEAELLSAIVRSLQIMGITSKDVGIKVNSRKLLNALMMKVGIPAEKFVATSVLIDKLDKVALHSLNKEVDALGLTMNTMEELTALLQLKSIEEYKEILGEDSAAIQELQQLFTYAQHYQIMDWIEFNPTIVRGLAYYTGIVFEGFDRDRQLRAIFGGGRYDQLIASFSNPNTSSTTSTSIPAVGFGFGDAVIVELLKSKQLLPLTVTNQEIDIVAFGMDASAKALLYPVIQQLRQELPQLSIDLILEDRKVKGVFQKANKVQAKYVFIVGEDEVKEQVITVKNMLTSEQQRIPVQDMKKVVREYFTKSS